MVTLTRTWQTVGTGIALGALALAAGCSGNSAGTSLLAITPTAAQNVDAGQSLKVTASVVNDDNHAGAVFNVQGLGTVSNPVVTTAGYSTMDTVTYTAPTTVTAGTVATIIAASVHTPAQSAALTVNLYTALAISTTTLPGGTTGTSYAGSVAATGGYGSYTYAVSSGALPAGLGLNGATGAITGTPTTGGSFTFSVTVTDQSAGPATVTQSFTIVISTPPPVVTPTTLPNAVAGTPYGLNGTGVQLAYTGGGAGTPSWAETGALPMGLTLSTSGLISGTPTNASAGQTYPFTVTVTVGTQTSVAQQLSITVPALPLVTTTSLHSGNVGIAYSQQLTYSGGAGGTVTWAISPTGALTGTGLSLSSSGLLTGSPTTATTYNFSVTVTVGTQTSAPQALTLVINSLLVTSGPTASGEVGLPFNFQLTAAGGTGPYTWSLAGGSAALPGPLSLNGATGVITGLPTATSTTTGVVVQATDSKNATATQAMTFTINAARSAANNSQLKGQYAFLLSGFDGQGHPLAAAGSFTADGNGNVTGGSLDENGTGIVALSNSNVAITGGTYSVGPDERGKVVLTTGGGTSTFVVAMDSVVSNVASAGYMTEFDASGNSLTGVVSLQTLPATLTGGYAFGEQGFGVNSSATALTHRAAAGEMQFSGGTFSSAEFLSSAATSAAPTVPTSGTLGSQSANGRAPLSLVQPNGAGTLNFTVYVVSATKFYVLSADAAMGTTGTNDLLAGTALQQTGPFSASSLSGTSVFRTESLGTTTSTGARYADVQVGLYSFPGSSTLSITSDENAGGAAKSNASSATYSVASTGRVTVTPGSSTIGGCINCVAPGQTFFYLVAANQGFVMDYSAAANSGYFEPQTATGITNASFSGAYAAGTLTPLAQAAPYVAEALTASVGGALSGTVDQNTNGTLTPDTALSATYVTAASGRTTITPAAGDNSVAYIVSTTKAVSLDLVTATPVVQEVVHQ